MATRGISVSADRKEGGCAFLGDKGRAYIYTIFLVGEGYKVTYVFAMKTM